MEERSSQSSTTWSASHSEKNHSDESDSQDSAFSQGSGKRRRQKFDIRKHGIFTSKKEQAFVAMTPGMGIYLLSSYGLEETENAATILQVFVAYLVVVIPAAYMQMVLGQYAHMGVFLVRRMVPIADGLGFSYCVTVFFVGILSALHTTVYILYIFMALMPGPLQWSLCNNQPNCWEVQKICNKSEGCISHSVYISAFIYWNTTIVAGVPKLQDRHISSPLGERVLVSLVVWVVIYLLSVLPLLRLKKIAVITTIAHLVMKAGYAIYTTISAGPVHVFIDTTSRCISNLVNFTAWRDAVLSSVITMTLGDFSQIMVGAVSGDRVKTGTVCFLAGTLSFTSDFLTDMLVTSSSLILCKKVNIPFSKSYLLFRPISAPTVLTVIPTIFEFMGGRTLWNILYFTNITIGILLRAIFNTIFLLEAISHRFPMLSTYKKYINPMYCFFSWIIGTILLGNAAHEIRKNFESVTVEFCQCVNVFIFAMLVSYVYGVLRFVDDVHFLQKSRPGLYWLTTWTLLPALLILNIKTEYLSRQSTFFRERVVEICIMFSPYMILTTYEIIKKILERKTITLIQAEAKWGPREVERRLKRRMFNPRKQTRYMRGTLHCHHQCIVHNKVIKNLVTKENEIMSRLGGVKTHKEVSHDVERESDDEQGSN